MVIQVLGQGRQASLQAPSSYRGVGSYPGRRCVRNLGSVLVIRECWALGGHLKVGAQVGPLQVKEAWGVGLPKGVLPHKFLDNPW